MKPSPPTLKAFQLVLASTAAISVLLVGMAKAQLREIQDIGYSDGRQAYVDINRDGYVDYCRVVGDNPRKFISCKLATRRGLEFGVNEYSYNSRQGVDLGYNEYPKRYLDANGDGFLDYCRYVGGKPPWYACVLGDRDGFSYNNEYYRPSR